MIKGWCVRVCVVVVVERATNGLIWVFWDFRFWKGSQTSKKSGDEDRTGFLAESWQIIPTTYGCCLSCSWRVRLNNVVNARFATANDDSFRRYLCD